MIDIPLPQGRTLERAREAFAEIDTVAALLRPSQPVRKRVAASALYAAADDDDADQEVADELKHNRHARRVHAHVLAQTAQFAFGTLRAASSGQSSERHGDGCHIRIERSRAEPDQYFVVVQLLRDASTGQAPTSLILCDHDDRCRRFPLPAVRNGVAQFIAEADSELLQLMGDPATRVYLG
jgi:hypothetical protein